MISIWHKLLRRLGIYTWRMKADFYCQEIQRLNDCLNLYSDALWKIGHIVVNMKPGDSSINFPLAVYEIREIIMGRMGISSKMLAYLADDYNATANK